MSSRHPNKPSDRSIDQIRALRRTRSTIGPAESGRSKQEAPSMYLSTTTPLHLNYSHKRAAAYSPECHWPPCTWRISNPLPYVGMKAMNPTGRASRCRPTRLATAFHTSPSCNAMAMQPLCSMRFRSRLLGSELYLCIFCNVTMYRAMNNRKKWHTMKHKNENRTNG